MKTKCKHGRIFCRCVECGGASTCVHARDKYLCIECRGTGICEHLRQRSYCPQCNPRGVYRSYRNSARKRGLTFELSFTDFSNLLNAPCRYCGCVPSLGVDRADNAFGYSPANCLPCCNIDNLAKRTMNQYEYLEHIAKVYNFQFRSQS